jgi:hypothetical protein
MLLLGYQAFPNWDGLSLHGGERLAVRLASHGNGGRPRPDESLALHALKPHGSGVPEHRLLNPHGLIALPRSSDS